MRGLVKAEIARRVLNEAMKPKNQEKAKRAFNQLRDKHSSKRQDPKQLP